ncbi:hypothetical protein AJ80_09518 [Polytolypa hystricis UAMH7299]|uniref:Uncharacterized protein n=1 Tax=Polytolypa hystricis (strain UAMH7299) TaxID=1447883 RepID=A0A2B7WPQ9_POLH7|nr:hypothetical protein AJ80_09518 [Polytolypa hystricis UAMH7299]
MPKAGSRPMPAMDPLFRIKRLSGTGSGAQTDATSPPFIAVGFLRRQAVLFNHRWPYDEPMSAYPGTTQTTSVTNEALPKEHLTPTLPKAPTTDPV